MVLDYERCWLALKQVIVEKKSHGQKDLLKAMTDIELECRVAEAADLPEPDLRKATTEDPSGPAGMPDQTTPLTDSQGDGYGSSSKAEAALANGR